MPTPDPPAPALGPPLLGALLRMPVDVIRERMTQALHEQGYADLAGPHLVVLRYPGPDGRRPSEIAAGSGMSKQALNYLLGQLEALGYLERVPDPDDHRSKRVRLTERGHGAMRTIRAAVGQVEREWAEALGDEEVERLRAILTRLAGVLGEPGATAGGTSRAGSSP